MITALDRFFEHYYRRRPVSATFTGVHQYDRMLPDWSPEGLAAMDDEMSSLRAELSRLVPSDDPFAPANLDTPHLDALLARDYLAAQLMEHAGRHGPAGNPALWTGEAFLGVASLMLRDFAPMEERISCATARLEEIPGFLASARRVLGGRPIPSSWVTRARRECEGGLLLLSRGIERWTARVPSVPSRLADAARRASQAVTEFADWVASHDEESDLSVGAGPELYDLLLARGHYCDRGREALLADAREQLALEVERLHDLARRFGGSWPEAQQRIASHHPDPDDYLAAFTRTWNDAREAAIDADLLTWPDWPIRYLPHPPAVEDSAPFLYYLHYRSPAPFDEYHVHDYLVPRLPAGGEQAHLRVWNHSIIKLNHVVHHGGIGHHVQNWYAYHRCASRIGQIAAVDCANRIGMFCGGTMAEGWACYVTGLMDEAAYLTPLDRAAEQHTRVRALARAIADIEIHQGTMSLDRAVAFYVEEAGMSPDGARGEAVRNSMFPCAALMYWLGTQGIRDLRESMRRTLGPRWSLKRFHDELLSYGSIPVPIVARLMMSNAVPTVSVP